MEKELTLGDIFAVILKRFWLIVLCAVIGLSGAYIGTTYFMTKQYTASTSLFVRSDSDNKTAQALATDLNISMRLVDTYMVILKSDSVLSEVANKLNLGYSAGDIGKMIKTSPVEETEVINVSVTNPNPAHAQLIANTIAETAPAEIIRVVKVGSVEILDKAKLPSAPSSPNVKINSLIGLLAGLVLSILISLLLEMINTSVKGEEDLREKYPSCPILGNIPNMDESK